MKLPGISSITSLTNTNTNQPSPSTNSSTKNRVARIGTAILGTTLVCSGLNDGRHILNAFKKTAPVVATAAPEKADSVASASSDPSAVAPAIAASSTSKKESRFINKTSLQISIAIAKVLTGTAAVCLAVKK